MENNILNSSKTPNQGKLTFCEIIDGVDNNFCLPAIQRGVVWSKDDIASFFDSLYKGFPVGNIIMWEIADKDKTISDFYPINKNEEKNNLRGNKKIYNFSIKTNQYCIIDGQQRITALYKGLSNHYVMEGAKNKYLLYFNVLYNDAEQFAFKYFIEKNYILEENHLWIPVKNLWNLFIKKENLYVNIDKYIEKLYDNPDNYKNGKLERKTNPYVKKIDEICKYYYDNKKTIAKKNIERIVNLFKYGGLTYSIIDLDKISTCDNNIEKLFEVFVRLNKSGRPLNPTDLLFAQLSKNSSTEGLWELFDETIDFINKHGTAISRFSQDHILRFIWLAFRQNDSDSFNKFFMTNANQKEITPEIMKKIRDAFVHAKCAFIDGHFRFDRKIPYSMFLPIAYYFYYNGSKSAQFEIERYYEISLLSDAFGQSTDTVMSKIVQTMGKNNKGNVVLFGSTRKFDFSKLINELRNNGCDFFDISNDDIENILRKNYVNDREYILRILNLISRKNQQSLPYSLDVDHIHPKKYLDYIDEYFNAINKEKSDSTAIDMWEFYRKHINEFPNMQLLGSSWNRVSKNDKLLDDWIKDDIKIENAINYANSCFICDEKNNKLDISYFSLSNFEQFFNNRKNILRNELIKMFEIKEEYKK